VPAYTIANLKDDVEDQAPKFGHSPDLEARFAGGALECEQLGLSYQRLAPNVRMPFGHRHKEQEEVYVVVEGSGKVKLGDDVAEVRQWDAVRVAPDTVRTFEAGPDGLVLLALGATAVAAGDVEMTDAW
jgi:uncharacterized cupin superfamily protein